MNATGTVVKAFGNLIHVKFEGSIKQGEVAFVLLEDIKIFSEVIEIASDIAKLQVFEDTYGIALNTKVEFCGHLLEAELGPGLLSSIFDGLQNPLQVVSDKLGVFLERGHIFSPLDRKKKWEFTPKVNCGDKVSAGDTLGTVPEARIEHCVMVPFSSQGSFEIKSVVEKGSYSIDHIIAVAVDEEGNECEFTMVQRWPIKKMLQFGEREALKDRMVTGFRILDTQFPMVKGGTFSVPGPFGAGKTVFQHHLSKYSAVDIVVLIACGERAGEVVEVLKTFPNLVDPYSNEPLMNRTIIICNTSSMPVAAREASVYMGVTIGEYYRQMGLDILALADSTSRWAQAMREMSGRLEEIPGEEAFPAYLSSRISSFYERAGNLRIKNGKNGTLTIGGAVSPAGGNFEEPVTKATLSCVGAFYGLSKERSEERKYPAIKARTSWTKYSAVVGQTLGKEWLDSTNEMVRLIVKSEDIAKRMEVVGQEGISIEEFVCYLKGELYDNCYLQQNSFDKEDAYCSEERQKEIFALMMCICRQDFKFSDQNHAHTFFLELQNELKNINFLSFQSDSYKDALRNVESMLKGVQ